MQIFLTNPRPKNPNFWNRAGPNFSAPRANLFSRLPDLQQWSTALVNNPRQPRPQQLTQEHFPTAADPLPGQRNQHPGPNHGFQVAMSQLLAPGGRMTMVHVQRVCEPGMNRQFAHEFLGDLGILHRQPPRCYTHGVEMRMYATSKHFARPKYRFSNGCMRQRDHRVEWRYVGR